MARRTKKQEILSKELTPQETRIAIQKLSRRVNELKSFDLNSITERYDPRIRIEALEQKIDDTLVSIFGHNTVEYNRCSIYTLDHAPTVIGDVQRDAHDFMRFS